MQEEVSNVGAANQNQPGLHSSSTSRSPDADTPAKNQRVVSHSQSFEQVPEVLLANNRHIFPVGGLQGNNATRLSDNVRNSSHRPESADSHLANGRDQESPPHESNGTPTRPALHKHNASWGVSIVNDAMKEQIRRDVFEKLEKPVEIHSRRHRRRGYETLPKIREADARLSHRALPGAQHSSSLLPGSGSQSGELMKSNKSVDMQYSNKAAVTHPTFEGNESRIARQQIQLSALNPEGFSRTHSQASRTNNVTIPGAKQLRRRHSGTGLLSRQTNVDSNERSGLRYYDDEGFGGDKEDMFPIDIDHPAPLTAPMLMANMQSTEPSGLVKELTPLTSSDGANESPGPDHVMAKLGEMPLNPEQARVQHSASRPFSFYWKI